MHQSRTPNPYSRALTRILTPVIRFCVRRDQAFQFFVEVAKKLFVLAARDELSQRSFNPNVSRISAMTGIDRREVKRFLDEDGVLKRGSDVNLVAQLLALWETHPTFSTKRHSPRVLSEEEFKRLAELTNKSLNSGTVLFELLRRGMVEKSAHGIRLIQGEVIHGENTERAYTLLGRDYEALLEVVDANTSGNEAIRNLHLHTEYDNIAEEHLPEIRLWMLNEGRELHKRARAFLAKFDIDGNPALKEASPGGKRVVLTSFSMTSPLPPVIGESDDVA